MKKIFIIAVSAKKQAGGGYHLAADFCRRTLKDNRVDWYYFVSQSLHELIGTDFINLKEKKYFVVPSQPDIHSYLSVRKLIRDKEKQIKPDLIYSIIAPSYFTFHTYQVMHHTDAYTYNSMFGAYDSWPFMKRIRQESKEFLIRHMLNKADAFETQSHMVADGIHKATGKYVEVIPNVLPTPFFNIDINKQKIVHQGVNVIYVAAQHPHKRVDIIPSIAKILVSKFGVNNIHFYYTLPFESERAKLLEDMIVTYEVQDYVSNLGYLDQQQLIDVYLKCDIGFFASLLETFSSTLLEYMKFQLGIVATDLPFNTEVTEDAALYFKPNDAEDAAYKIYSIIEDSIKREKMIEASKERLKVFGDYEVYYNRKISYLLRCINDNILC